MCARLETRVKAEATPIQEEFGLHYYIDGGFMYGGIHGGFERDSIVVIMGLSWHSKNFHSTRQCSFHIDQHWAAKRPTAQDYSDFEDHCLAEFLGNQK